MVSVIDVQKAYLAYFGRPADTAGLDYWMNSDAATMRAGFAASAEYAALYSGMTAEQRVEQVYQNLLGRASDAAGKAYWVNEFNAGRETVSSLVTSMQTNALGVDISTIDNRVTYAILFTAQLDTPAEVVGYSGTAAADAARDAVSAVTYTDASLATARSTIVADTASVVAGIAPSVAAAEAAAAAAAAAIPPSLSSSTPADNATGVVVGNNLVLTFSEAIVLGTGDIVLKKTIGNVVVETFNVATGIGSAGGTVTASGAGVTINPFADLTGGTEYYVTVAATAVKDTTGNSYAGITSTTALSFFTATSGSAYSLTGGNDNITGTASDDIFTGTYGDGAGGTFGGISDTLDGGLGTDTLNLTIGAFATTSVDANFTNISNFEKIVFNTTGAGAQTITGGTEFNAAFTTTIDLTAQTTEGAITIDLSAAAVTKAATVTATTSVSGAQTITTGSGATTVNATTNNGAQNISGAGLTTVNANATIGAQTITSTAATTVTVIAIAGDGNQTITTAGGNDSVTLTTKAGALTTINTGAGNDTIVASLGTDTITGGTGADSMTGGAGADVYVQANADSVAFTAKSRADAAAWANADTITFGSGVDKIVGFTTLVDDFDTAGTSANPTTLVGLNSDAVLTANTIYGVRGTFVSGTGVFTIDTAAGTDFLVVNGIGGALSANAGAVVLIGTTAVVAADFI